MSAVTALFSGLSLASCFGLGFLLGGMALAALVVVCAVLDTRALRALYADPANYYDLPLEGPR